MKDILLLAHDDTGQEARLQAALDLVRVLDGRLTCLDVIEVPVVGADAWVPGGHGVLVAEACEQDVAHRTRMKARLQREDVCWEWKDAAGDLSTCLREATGLADIIVASARGDSAFGLASHQHAAELVRRSKVPVLAVPDTLRRFDPTGRVLVAWDGSAHSVSALHAAVPLLRKAKSVIILEVKEDWIASPAENAAAYLSRHDIHAVVERRSKIAPSIAATIRDEIADKRIDYVVMGAFSHSRLTEAVFGGVSREMLKTTPVPLFMAH